MWKYTFISLTDNIELIDIINMFGVKKATAPHYSFSISSTLNEETFARRNFHEEKFRAHILLRMSKLYISRA